MARIYENPKHATVWRRRGAIIEREQSNAAPRPVFANKLVLRKREENDEDA